VPSSALTSPVAKPDKVRVLFLHSATRPPLGADTWIHTLIMRHLDRSTHEVHVACSPGPADAPTPTFAAVRGIPDLTILPVNLGPELFAKSAFARARAAFETAPAFWNVAALARYVRKHRIGVIHTSDRPRDALASVAVAKLTGAKSIVHVHVTYGEWMSPMLRWAMRRADSLIGVSEFVAHSLVQGGGYSPARTESVLNAIDLPKWDYRTDAGSVRTEFGIPTDAPVMICVARLFAAKGQAQLIRALSQLHSELPSLRLLVVGQDYPPGTRYSEELRALAGQLGAADNVIFTGLRSDVPRLMAASDLFAMASLEEPFGLVYAEAMAMKRPVVALDNGGTPEVVEHGKSGLLSASGDTAALAANIRTLVRDPALRARMGEYGRQRVETRFSPGRLAADVARVYGRLLAHP
jgi:glycosyltransferase involved in cell wall biosynthesis